jgi:hypothetical protein
MIRLAVPLRWFSHFKPGVLSVDQQEFQGNLEFRICREFAGMSDGKLRELWCDGVMLEAFLVDDPRPRILGGAWICTDSNQEVWRLELLLPRRLQSVYELHWETLLPAENVTKWLAIDRENKLIQIEPAAAEPDLE